MTAGHGDSTTNDELGVALRSVLDELRDDEEQTKGKTFRALIYQRVDTLKGDFARLEQFVEAEVRDVRQQQRQMFWLVAGSCAAILVKTVGW